MLCRILAISGDSAKPLNLDHRRPLVSGFFNLSVPVRRASASAPVCAAFDIPPPSALGDVLFNHMSQLHPYWRMEYIEAPRPPDMPRPFTALPALGDDRAALIVHRSALSYLMLNRFPYNPGHLLAIPFREVVDLTDLNPAESADLMATLVFGERLLRAVMKPDAFNIGFNLGRPAGGSIDHLHGHIVPRWNGDNNFMPVLGQTRILPQALEQTWEKLSAEAARMANA